MYKRKDGRFCKAITIDGKRVFFYSKAPSEREAERDIQSQLLNYRTETHTEKHNFWKIAQRVIENKERTCGYKTIETYTVALKHLSEFSERNIEDIKPNELQALLNRMLLEKYSKSAMQKVKVLYSLILKRAVLEGVELGTDYFLKAVSIPKTPKAKTSAPDEDIIKKIIESGDEWALCLLFTGLRRGELAALQKQDVDFENGLIHVTKSVEYIHNQPHVKPTPKTESSIGDVPILSVLKPILLKLTKNARKGDFLFGGIKPLSETQVKKRWQKFCTENGIAVKGHQLRHAYATILYRSGVDVKTAQRLLRHADFSTTMNIYTDFEKNVTAEAVKKIDIFTRSL